MDALKLVANNPHHEPDSFLISSWSVEGDEAGFAEVAGVGSWHLVQLATYFIGRWIFFSQRKIP